MAIKGKRLGLNPLRKLPRLFGVLYHHLTRKRFCNQWQTPGADLCQLLLFFSDRVLFFLLQPLVRPSAHKTRNVTQRGSERLRQEASAPARFTTIKGRKGYYCYHDDPLKLYSSCDSNVVTLRFTLCNTVCWQMTQE